MKVSLLRSRLLLLPLALACLLPAGCGGGGSDAPATAKTTPISGTVTAGPVNGGAVTVLDAANAIVAGPVTTQADGSFTINIPDSHLNENLVFSCTGGSYPDEATGTNTDVGTGTLSARLDSLATGASVNLTPGSTIVRELIKAGKTRTEAENLFSGSFGFIPDPGVAPNLTGVGSDAQNIAGLFTSSFSYLTQNLTLSPSAQLALLTGIAADLADDGLLNGSIATNPPPATTGSSFATVFKARLNALAKIKQTASYKVEFQPGMMGAAQGKTVFNFKITNKADDTPVTGATPSVYAVMAMPGMSHSTPVDSVTEVGGGVYQCTIYYLMASSMNGKLAGYWSLDITVNNETATFHPDVAMSMGDTSKVNLKDSGDKYASGMMGSAVRYYPVFKDSLTGTDGNYSLALFISTNTSMMDFPALVVGQTLHNESGTAWTVNTVTVEASLDSGANWTTMTNNGTGHWSVGGLPLATNQQATVLVRLKVNDVEKTTTGATAANGGLPASFTVTPK